uniref:Uncharacterized protein n=1 Tax=Leptobrachium leishanense TaxID=445787 RepID=A0A8C5W7N4_9ANUR
INFCTSQPPAASSFHLLTLPATRSTVQREAFFSILDEEIQKTSALGYHFLLIPRLLGDIFSLWICNMVAYLINTYALENGAVGEMIRYSQAVTGFLIDCWRQLSREGNMSQGNSLFFRKVPAGKKYIYEQKRILLKH